MAQYRYQARLSSGQVQAGVLSADTAQAAATILRNQGHHVLQLVPLQSGNKVSGSNLSKALSYSSGPSQKDVLDFTSQLAVMVRAGISLRAALEGITEQIQNPKFRKILLAVRMDVESGKQFSDAIARYPKQFSSLYVNMVRASEMSGSFSEMLDRIADFLLQAIETRKMVIGAMIYPGIIGTMAVSVTIFLLTFVLPRFAMVFKGKEDALPGPTKFLLWLSDWLVTFWYIPVMAAFGIGVAFWFFVKTEIGALWFDKAKLSMPLLRKMFRALYISRSLSTMGELLNAGVPMLDTIAITGDISGNLLFKKMWRGVYSSVKQGKKIATQLHKSTLLPKAVIQMISAGEESGKLGEVLHDVSGFYQRALREAIKTVTSMIEPIMIVAMGGIVGFIAMSVILPIFKMSTIVSN